MTSNAQPLLADGTTTVLPPGTTAPDFTLQSNLDHPISLRDYRGHPVILVFYPADWSPVCTDQLAVYNEILPEFQRYDAAILGLSVDGKWCHRAFATDRHLDFPLLSDFEPKGAVSRHYRAYISEDGTSARALFVVDPEGKIHWSYLSPIAVNPGANGILAALEDLAQAH